MTASENQIVVYQPNETVRLDVRLENETVWLTQLKIVELKEKVDFFVRTKEPPLQSIFYPNKFWDAKSLLIKFIRRAKKELIAIDAYSGVATLDMFAMRGRGVKIKLADLKSQIATSTMDLRDAA